MKDPTNGTEIFPTLGAAANYIQHVCRIHGLMPAHHIDGLASPPSDPAEFLRRYRQVCAFGHHFIDVRDDALREMAQKVATDLGVTL